MVSGRSISQNLDYLIHHHGMIRSLGFHFLDRDGRDDWRDEQWVIRDIIWVVKRQWATRWGTRRAPRMLDSGGVIFGRVWAVFWRDVTTVVRVWSLLLHLESIQGIRGGGQGSTGKSPSRPEEGVIGPKLKGWECLPRTACPPYITWERDKSTTCVLAIQAGGHASGSGPPIPSGLLPMVGSWLLPRDPPQLPPRPLVGPRLDLSFNHGPKEASSSGGIG